MDDPALLKEIAAGLEEKDAALLGDCLEVLTQVSEQQPAWVAPFAKKVVPFLTHKNTRVRWEAMHTMANVSALVPELIQSLLPALTEIIHNIKSIIVRDYAVDVVANYASVDETAAEQATPILKEALSVWEGRHAGHALKGLTNVAVQVPALHHELQKIAESYLDHKRKVVVKAAKGLLKAAQ
jgi:vesicle coat complex subunit